MSTGRYISGHWSCSSGGRHLSDKRIKRSRSGRSALAFLDWFLCVVSIYITVIVDRGFWLNFSCHAPRDVYFSAIGKDEFTFIVTSWVCAVCVGAAVWAAGILFDARFPSVFYLFCIAVSREEIKRENASRGSLVCTSECHGRYSSFT